MPALGGRVRVFLGHLVHERLQIFLGIPCPLGHDAQRLTQRGKIPQRVGSGKHEIVRKKATNSLSVVFLMFTDRSRNELLAVLVRFGRAGYPHDE